MSADHPAAVDPLLAHARHLILEQQNPSVSFLQRNLKIDYSSALQLMQSLEGDIVTEPNGDGWRRMLQSGTMSPSDPQFTDYKLVD
jgi:DNA segregation ATPase FtsK/SpoIIIE-like protein